MSFNVRICAAHDLTKTSRTVINRLPLALLPYKRRLTPFAPALSEGLDAPRTPSSPAYSGTLCKPIPSHPSSHHFLPSVYCASAVAAASSWSDPSI